MSVVGTWKQLGEYISWESPCTDRKQYLRNNLPQYVNSDPYLVTFKQDIEIEQMVERLENVDLLYITMSRSCKDELYYFRINGHLYHGDKVWSQWHSFLPELRRVKPTHYVDEPSFFVGSRPNYTHQIVDFLPNLLLRRELEKVIPTSAKNIIGSENSILKEALRTLAPSNLLRSQLLQLSQYTDPDKSIFVDGWSLNCVRFSELYLVRHLSIFKAFSLLRNACASIPNKSMESSSPNQDHTRNGAIFLARSDNRIQNQSQLCSEVFEHESVEIAKELSILSMSEKYQYLSRFKTFIMPPGSENINAFCFANSNSRFIQMIPGKFTDLLKSPFHSYAGLRYNLPFLDRTLFWEPLSIGPGLNSASWSPHEMPPL